MIKQLLKQVVVPLIIGVVLLSLVAAACGNLTPTPTPLPTRTLTAAPTSTPISTEMATSTPKPDVDVLVQNSLPSRGDQQRFMMPDQAEQVPAPWQVENSLVGNNQDALTAGVSFQNALTIFCTHGGKYPQEADAFMELNCVVQQNGVWMREFKAFNGSAIQLTKDGQSIWLWFNGAGVDLILYK